MISRQRKAGRLSAESQERLKEILGTLGKDFRYTLETRPMNSGDLSRIVGYLVEIRLRNHNEEVIKIRTHYEGDGRRVAVTHPSYHNRLKSYDHGIEALDKFLREEDYEMINHRPKEEKKREAKKK